MVDVAMTSPERAIEELLKVRTGFKREAGQQGKVILTGPYSLDATYNGVRLAEDFDLQLVVPGDYPASLPTVRETSGVIDPGYEHLYLNGTFCLGVRGELLLAQLENPSLVALLDGPIRSYLYSYLFRKRYGNYPFGDRAHGVRGILRYYEELFGEADFLPGLVIDKFSDVLVVESLALGIDRMKEEIVDILKEVLSEDGITIRGVYERSDAKVRQNEGMERVKGFIGEEFDTKVEIVENGVRYMVDVKDGQKTGFFLDQKYNRLAIQRLCKDAEVLDCFTHTGSFALNAGIAGAKHVTGVDASELGIEQARENARLNGLEDRVEFVCADVFDLLPKLEEEGKQYDVVILDPPAFTKSRKTIKNATKGYREINMRGMKLVKPGGYLATCSCSHFMDYELFTKTIHQAAQNVHKRIRQVEYRTQAPDHPILWSAEESYYLKFYVFQIVDEK